MNDEPITRFMEHALKAEAAYRRMAKENAERRVENKALKAEIVRLDALLDSLADKGEE